MTTERDLIGGWSLICWDATVDGRPGGCPMGPDAGGLLLYSPDGIVSAILHTAGRPVFGTRLFRYGSAESQQMAALTYVSYGGAYELLDEQVHHHVEHSLFPDWVGTDLIRAVSWEDGDLVLTTLPEHTRSGKVVVNRLRWRRRSPKSQVAHHVSSSEAVQGQALR